MNLKTTYLVLAISGAIIPYVFFLQYFGEAGFGLSTFVTALFANGAAGDDTARDLLAFRQRKRER